MDLGAARDHPRTAGDPIPQAHESFAVSAATLSALTKLGRGCSTTVGTVLQAAYTIWLAEFTGETDYFSMQVGHGRDDPRWNATLGVFVNVSPVPVRLGRKPTVKQFITELNEALMTCLPKCGPMQILGTYDILCAI